MSPTGTGLLVGSLFTGYGGLDMAVAQVFPAARLAWVCEHEPATPKNRKPSNAAARVLAHRHPDVPNLGDITQQDWRTIRRVHILTGGYPCQPDSDAGLKLGEHDDRWLWPEYLKAIRALRPRWAIGENVRGHVQRGLRSVVADLQAEGYAVVWTTISASDVGACHGRPRVFWIAWPQEHGEPAHGVWPIGHLEGGRWVVPDLFGVSPVGRWPVAGAAYAGAAYAGAAQSGDLLPTPRTSDVHGVGAHGAGGPDLRTVIDLLPTPNASLGDTHRGGVLLPTPTARDHKGGTSPAGTVRADGRVRGEGDFALPMVVGKLLPTTTATDAKGGRNATAGRRNADSRHHSGTTLTDAVWQSESFRKLMPTSRATDADKGGPNQRGSSGDLMLPSAVQAWNWGQYAAAIARWEHVSGREAPAPTGPHGRRGAECLSGWFTEWLMGLPAGWVTDVPKITNKQAIRMCGNGVVPQQAAAALRLLLGHVPGRSM